MNSHSHPPRAAEKPSIISVADYFCEGRKRLCTATAIFSGFYPPAALIALHTNGERLRSSTARRYRQDDRRALEIYLRWSKRPGETEFWLQSLDEALDWRTRRRENGGLLPPLPKRTSSCKVIDATEYEARTAFYQLKLQALENGNIHTIIAALFVLVACHSGLRPIELIGARLVGTVLTLATAKARLSTELSRRIELNQLHPDVVSAVGLIIDLMPQFQNRQGFVRFRNRVREALRRACVRGNIRELSLYSFRHCAIATWKRAGMSPQHIARLAGHSSPLTAGRYYASGSVGHARASLVSSAIEEPVITQKPVTVQQVAKASIVDPILPPAHNDAADTEDMPAPIYRVQPRRTPVTAEQLAREKQKWSGEPLTRPFLPGTKSEYEPVIGPSRKDK